jgi:ammonium transporter
VSDLETTLQAGWLLLCTGLVLFMQAGFTVLEAGTVRHKNSINVAVKNIVTLVIAMPVFYIIGYSLTFGVDRYGLFGRPVPILSDKGLADYPHFAYQAMFCATAATIVSGAVAERLRFLPYVISTLGTSALIYPIFAHLVWGGGYLAQRGYHDFAGSSCVHMVGAGVSLAGVLVLGARNGRFGPDGKAKAVPASSMPMVALGVCILLFGWVGFNGGSAPLGPKSGLIITNTLLAACFGGLGALLSTWAYRGLAAVDLILNGVLGGLVAITACADIVTLHAAALIGVLGGIAVVIVTDVLERVKLDDAVGAIPVHGGAGLTGILCAAAFASPDALATKGLTRLGLLEIQATGAGICMVWSFTVGFVIWWLIGRLIALRVGPVEEAIGLNFSEHQVISPVQALTQSVFQAREGLALASKESSFDDIPDAQFEALVHAVKELVRDTGIAHRRSAQWSTDLDAISGTLDLNHRVGREAMDSYRDEVSNIDRALYHIAKHLSDGRIDATTLTIAVDSVINMRRRLELIQHKLPSAMDSWDQVSRMAERLDRLASTIRGDVRDTH